MLKIALAFIKRDFLIATSYKTIFALQFFIILFGVSMFYFVGQIFSGATSEFLSSYGGNYFSFLLIGMAFIDYHVVSLRIFSGSIQESQMTGTMEIILLSPVKLSSMLLCSSLWAYIFSSMRFIMYLSFGALLFGLNVRNINIVSVIVILLLSIICFASIGIFLAGIVMIFKRGDSVNVIVSSLSMFLGGVLYPIEVLPDWIKALSYYVPLTHALKGMRLSVLQGYSLYQLFPDAIVLTIFSLIFFPLGLLFFKFAVQRAKIKGTLTHY